MDIVRDQFKMLKELFDKHAEKNEGGVQLEQLSMGMTNDFELAIEEGATMIRIGRAIFGERNKSDSYYWPGIEGSSYKAK
jgi:uncharacterized pyridoxal phosphate-containing UPF0001 family protein